MKPKKKPLSRCTQWVQMKREEVLKLFGGVCQNEGCKSIDQLEFAHKNNNIANGGEGRGSYRRIKEVLKNPEAFVLLCKPCHYVYDNNLNTGRTID